MSKEYEIFILNMGGLEFNTQNCSDPHVVIDGLTIRLTPENLPQLYENDVEYMERFVFSVPDMPATEDSAFIDWYENTLPTQMGRSILWENGWYAEDSLSLVRPYEEYDFGVLQYEEGDYLLLSDQGEVLAASGNPEFSDLKRIEKDYPYKEKGMVVQVIGEYVPEAREE